MEPNKKEIESHPECGHSPKISNPYCPSAEWWIPGYATKENKKEQISQSETKEEISKSKDKETRSIPQVEEPPFLRPSPLCPSY